MALKATTPGSTEGPDTASIFGAIQQGNAEVPHPNDAPEVDEIETPEEVDGGDFEEAIGGDAYDDGYDDEDEGGDDDRGGDGRGAGHEKFKERAAGVSADVLTRFVDFAVSRGCAVLSGDGPERYRMDADERTMFTEAADAYLETVDVNVSPGQMFAMVSLMIFSPKMYEAGDRYYARKKTALRFKQANPAEKIEVITVEQNKRTRPVDYSTPTYSSENIETVNVERQTTAPATSHIVKSKNTPPTEITNGGSVTTVKVSENVGDVGKEPDVKRETIKETRRVYTVNPLIDLGGRTNFQFEPSTGMYKYDRNGKYAKAKLRTERVPDIIRKMWDEGKRSEHILEAINLAKQNQ